MKSLMRKTGPDFSLEKKFSHYGTVCGVDEAGAGPWAGPVFAAAAVLDFNLFPTEVLKLINDSKLLNHKKRLIVFEHFCALKDQSIFFGVGMGSVEEIDTLNIAKAIQLAMQRAVANLKAPPDFVLVDGNRDPKLNYPIELVIKGDQLSLSIAAASIIAKVTRDQLMTELSVLHPQYGWDRNAGYGTSEHQRALATHGVTSHHRRSYAPIKRLLNG